MAWEEALEAHVKENEQEFNRIAEAFAEVKMLITEQITSVTNRIDALESNMDPRFEAIDRRFDDVDKRFEAIDRRFDDVDKRFEGIDRRFDRLDGQLELIVKAIVKS